MMKVSDCVSTITARAVDITMVHENVITTCAVDHILPYLVKAPELKQLCSEPLVLNGTDSDNATFDATDYNVAFRYLEEFCDVTGMQAIKIPGVECDGAGVQSDFALFCIRPSA